MPNDRESEFAETPFLGLIGFKSKIHVGKETVNFLSDLHERLVKR